MTSTFETKKRARWTWKTFFLNKLSSRVDVHRRKCLSYSFIYEVYGKNAHHRKFIQNLKSVLKIFNEHFWSTCLFWSFLVIKKWFKIFYEKFLSYNLQLKNEISKRNFFVFSFREKLLIIQFNSMEKMLIIQFHLWKKCLFCFFHTLTFALWNCMKEYDKHFFSCMKIVW